MKDELVRKLKEMSCVPRAWYISRQLSTAKQIDFVIAGFPKCATTSIHRNLLVSKNVFMPDHEVKMSRLLTKEIDLDIGADRMIGIKNPNLVYEPHHMLALYKANKKTKFIISLRHPADFIFSFYQYRRMEYKNKKSWLLQYESSHPGCMEASFREFVYEDKKFADISLGSACFIDYLENICNFIPVENILIVFIEELAEKPNKFYSDIFTFLGLPYEEKEFPSIISNNNRNKYDDKDEYRQELDFIDGKLNIKNNELNRFLHDKFNITNSYW